MLLLYYVYQVGFSFWDTGYAAAMTMVLLALLAIVSLFQYGWLDRRVHYR
jgi:sn-glycerol 3-phosphate transport system permease protein